METTTVGGVVRDANGRFQPGSKSLGGRAPKAFEQGIKEALKERWPPQVISERIEEAYTLAKSQQSARGMLAAIELAASYCYGKPTITLAAANTNTELLERLLADDRPLLPPIDDDKA